MDQASVLLTTSDRGEYSESPRKQARLFFSLLCVLFKENMRNWWYNKVLWTAILGRRVEKMTSFEL